MCHSDRLSRKHGCPPRECRQQTASSYQLLEGLPQLQMNSLLQSHPLPGATTSCHWARQGLKGPELRTRLAEALFSLHHSMFSPFSKNPVSSPFSSQVLIANKHLAPQTPSQRLFPKNPARNSCSQELNYSPPGWSWGPFAGGRWSTAAPGTRRWSNCSLVMSWEGVPVKGNALTNGCSVSPLWDI